ncbi:MAG: DUF3570 domain-containing protein, partial [Myxococcota bacterium]
RINRFAATLGSTFIIDRATFAALTFTGVLELGDASKPYRHVPMFSPEVAELVAPGLVVDAVNFFREEERPLEQLPLSRKRLGVALLIAHRFSGSTLRVSERGYIDSWGTKATTTDALFLVDITDDIRLWPHVRFHAQTAADFYRLAYVVQTDAAGARVLPSVFTGDRELGPLLGLWLGGGVRFALNESLAMSVAGDFIYTRFLDHLFVAERLAGFGLTAFEGTFE